MSVQESGFNVHDWGLLGNNGELKRSLAIKAIANPDLGNTQAVDAKQRALKDLHAAEKLAAISKLAQNTERTFSQTAGRLDSAKGLGHLIHTGPAAYRRAGLDRASVVDVAMDEVKAGLAAQVFINEVKGTALAGQSVEYGIVQLSDSLFNTDDVLRNPHDLPITYTDFQSPDYDTAGRVVRAVAIMRTMAGLYLPESDNLSTETMRSRLDRLCEGILPEHMSAGVLTPGQFFHIWNSGILALGSVYGAELKDRSARLSQAVKPLLDRYKRIGYLLQSPYLTESDSLRRVGVFAQDVETDDRVLSQRESFGVKAAKYQQMIRKAEDAARKHLTDFSKRTTEPSSYLKEKYKDNFPPGFPFGIVSAVEQLI